VEFGGEFWNLNKTLDGKAEPRYPRQEIFRVDAGYLSPQKSGG
jgi:hypothetical protein